MQAIIMARVSSHDQKDNWSNPIQIENGKAFCQREGHKIIGEYTLVESSVRDRKKFNEIITRIEESKEPILLVVNAVDRFQRSYRETLLIDNLRQQNKIEVQFLREGLRIKKDSTAMEILIWDALVMVAKAENGIKRERVMASAKARIDQGLWNHEAPFGYRNVQNEQTRRGEVKIHPINAPIVQEIFSLFQTGNYSMQILADKLNATGRTFHGKTFKKQQISVILNRSFYYGVAEVAGKQFRHAHDTLITKDQFDVCQVLLGKRKTSKIKLAGKEFLFKNLAKCESCGWTITPDGPKKGNNYMMCKNPKCMNYNVGLNEKVYIDLIEKTLSQMVFSEEIKSEMLKYIKEVCQSDKNDLQAKHIALSAEKRDLELKLDRILELLMDGSIDRDIYSQKKESLTARLSMVDIDILELTEEKIERSELIEGFLDTLEILPALFKSSNLKQKYALLKSVTSNLFQDGKKVRFEAKKPFSEMIKSDSSQMWLRRQDSNL